MEFTTIDFCKICGIIFFIMMAWYFAFVVFKTNKDFLSSIVHEPENPSSLDDIKSLFGTSLKEGFSGEKGTTTLSNIEEKLKKQLSILTKEYNLDEEGNKDKRKLITSILEKRIKVILLQGVDTMTKHDQVFNPAIFKHSHEGAKYLLNIWNKQVEKLNGGGGW
jgi:hypothetical protein